MSKSFWDTVYENMPLDNIPWQHTQDDWFQKLMVSGVISGKNALDLGCGTGIKTIQLAKAGFEKVIGIDIAKKAIEYAKANAKKSSVTAKTEFIARDATDLSFLGDEKFDFVLDWANLHCIPNKQVDNYTAGIISHTHPGAMILIRVFAKPLGPSSTYFIDKSGGSEGKIYLYDDAMINRLFGKYFQTIQTNQSMPRTKSGRVFNEYLLKRK